MLMTYPRYRSTAKNPAKPLAYYEAEVAEGLEDVAANEIQAQFGAKAILRAQHKRGMVAFDYSGEISPLFKLKTVIAVYLVQPYAVPRPRALLGHEHLTRLLEHIDTAKRHWPPNSYQSLFISAAGSESAVMTRLKQEICDQTGMSIGDEKGDLFIRLRRAVETEGWECLVRLSPRPLASRSWRVENMPGSLNASVAHAMLRLLPRSEGLFLNIGCGSGTFLIERLAAGPVTNVVGCDISSEALTFSRRNIAEARLSRKIDLLQCDGAQLPFPASSVDEICADLPFGQLVGTHTSNKTLYPALLAEAARVAKPDGSFIILTHEIRLMESLLRRMDTWNLKHQRQITLNGIHPVIYVLTRRHI